MAQNRYYGKLREQNQKILELCPANTTLRLELALEMKKRLEGIIEPDVMEFGIGEGDLTKYLMQYNPNAMFDLLDKSPEMIEMAKEKLHTFYYDKIGCEFICEDIENYFTEPNNPFANCYDAIASAWTIHNFPWKSKINVFHLCYTALKEGGSFLMMDKVYQDSSEFQKKLLNLQNYRYSRYLEPEIAKFIMEHEMQDFSDKYRMDESPTLDALKKIGFKNILILDRVERDVLLVARK